MCSDIWAVLLDMFRRIKQDKSTTWRFQRPHKQANHLGRVAYFKRFLFFLHSPGPSEVQSKDLYQAYWKSHVSFQQSGKTGPFLQCLECLLLLRWIFHVFCTSSGLELARVPRVPGTHQNSEHHLWHPLILRFLILTGITPELNLCSKWHPQLQTPNSSPVSLFLTTKKSF